MTTVYIVMSSNCEEWEDYWEHIDSIWSTREAAVRRIEEGLGMEKKESKSPQKPFSRDRWSIEVCDRLQPDDCDDMLEYNEAVADNGGEPPIVWSQEWDAWIVEHGVQD